MRGHRRIMTRMSTQNVLMNHDSDWIINWFLFERQNDYAAQELGGFTTCGSWNLLRFHSKWAPKSWEQRKMSYRSAVAIVWAAFSFALSESSLSSSSFYCRSHRISLTVAHSIVVIRISYWLTAAVACAIFANRKCGPHSRQSRAKKKTHYSYTCILMKTHACALSHTRSTETTQIELQTFEIRWRLSDLLCVCHFSVGCVARKRLAKKKSRSINLNKQNSRPEWCVTCTVNRTAKSIRVDVESWGLPIFTATSAINHSSQRHAKEASQGRSAAALYLHARCARASCHSMSDGQHCLWDLWCDRARIHCQSIALCFAVWWKVDIRRARALSQWRSHRAQTQFFTILISLFVREKHLRRNSCAQMSNGMEWVTWVRVCECWASAALPHSLLLFVSVCFFFSFHFSWN